MVVYFERRYVNVGLLLAPYATSISGFIQHWSLHLGLADELVCKVEPYYVTFGVDLC